MTFLRPPLLCFLCVKNKKACNISVTGLCFKITLSLQFLESGIADPVSIGKLNSILTGNKITDINGN
jgi:hypothetical protein